MEGWSGSETDSNMIVEGESDGNIEDWGENQDDQNGSDKTSCSCSMDCSASAVRTRTIHVSSLLLAAKSPFFYKLFSNGMRESEQRDVTIHLRCTEEAAFMDLLNFIYCETLKACTRTALLKVLMVADKFEVLSCMHFCADALQSLSTPESALSENAKELLIKHLAKNKKFEEEIMDLPLASVEDALSKDELQVGSEDVLYDIVITWARKHYPNHEERREVLCNRLSHLIRFPHMTNRKLRKILSHRHNDFLSSLNLVSEALLFKTEPTHKRRNDAPDGILRKRFCERSYTHKPIKVVEFDTPHRECMVFWDIKREDCLTLFPNNWLTSQAFYLGGEPFRLTAHCGVDNHTHFPCFGLWLMMENKDEVILALEYEFAARSKPSSNFSVKLSGMHRFGSKKMIGSSNLFGMPWKVFVSKSNPYFINNVLHMRSVLTMKT
ncbi:hypothetical protein SUGI_0002680 [Cryptomeria japonica]|nr:hypothetical protein SUGI_0002680 [Cryptomeria japonica]